MRLDSLCRYFAGWFRLAVIIVMDMFGVSGCVWFGKETYASRI